MSTRDERFFKAIADEEARVIAIPQPTVIVLLTQVMFKVMSLWRRDSS